MNPHDLLLIGLWLAFLKDPLYEVRKSIIECRIDDTRRLIAADIGRHSHDADCAAWCERKLRQHRREQFAALKNRIGKFPWIDSLPLDWQNRDLIIRYYLWEVGGGGSAECDWSGYRRASELFFEQQVLDENINISKLIDMLAVMRSRCEHWTKFHKYPS